MIYELLSNYIFWVSLGIALIIIEIFIGAEFYSLSIGLASTLTGFIISSDDIYNFLIKNLTFLNEWQLALIIWAMISLLILIPLKMYMQKSNIEDDINKY
ncbi:MAG: hypothetical protein CL691_03395 [Cellvibrionales bacterium]|nr:hypothetical protein [Cellvibrionales bacterium]|tara:strand:- start:3767 stop:4066 length:300 start_codon:yes stop_codon:yes gene_type:complete